MPIGLLEVAGTIDVAQVWPSGESDADTVKVVLSGSDAFRFTPQPGAAAKVTHAFEGARIKGAVNKPAIDNQNRITIRLQGIDAPELHYRPTAPTLNGKKPTADQRTKFNAANGNFRQHYGETAATALGDLLGKAGRSPIACSVRTAVDQPGDVFDTFGRFIGDVLVTVDGKQQNVNQFLCENGWAFPTFYASMSNEEIETLTKLSESARKAKRGIWKRATADISSFDRTLLFRKDGTPDPSADAGPVYLPKLFRRRSTYAIAKLAKITSASFKNYLVAEPDHCFVTSDFLDQGPTAATPRHLDEFVTTSSRLTVAAKDLVFQENASQVVDKNGKPVQW